MTTQILVGCDPEIFVKKNGIFHSAHGLVKGTKDHPFKVEKGAVQVDGMALEFNIDPAHDETAFITNVSHVLSQLRAMVPDFELAAVPVADFDPLHMKAQPAEALELGCDPDYNGWTGEVNPKPDGNRNFRTASGHVHIGWTNDIDPTDPAHQGLCNAVARQMDFYLGLPSLWYDTDTRRRSMYGEGGCLRYKPYGMEYRTLSNQWLNSEKLMGWVFRNAVKGTRELLDNSNALFAKYGDIRHIINTSDKGAAEHIINAEGIEVPSV